MKQLTLIKVAGVVVSLAAFGGGIANADSIYYTGDAGTIGLYDAETNSTATIYNTETIDVIVGVINNNAADAEASLTTLETISGIHTGAILDNAESIGALTDTVMSLPNVEGMYIADPDLSDIENEVFESEEAAQAWLDGLGGGTITTEVTVNGIEVLTQAGSTYDDTPILNDIADLKAKAKINTDGIALLSDKLTNAIDAATAAATAAAVDLTNIETESVYVSTGSSTYVDIDEDSIYVYTDTGETLIDNYGVTVYQYNGEGDVTVSVNGNVESLLGNAADIDALEDSAVSIDENGQVSTKGHVNAYEINGYTYTNNGFGSYTTDDPAQAGKSFTENYLANVLNGTIANPEVDLVTESELVTAIDGYATEAYVDANGSWLNGKITDVENDLANTHQGLVNVAGNVNTLEENLSYLESDVSNLEDKVESITYDGSETTTITTDTGSGHPVAVVINSNGLEVTGPGSIYIGEDEVATKDYVDSKVGTDGKDGKDGADGADGAKGDKGDTGADGKDGKDGVDGVTTIIHQVDSVVIEGIDGTDGVDGKDGIDGIDGAKGDKGDAGVDGIDGVDGKDGIDGKDGKDGTNGVDGTDGADGKDGVDGVTTIVADEAAVNALFAELTALKAELEDAIDDAEEAAADALAAETEARAAADAANAKAIADEEAARIAADQAIRDDIENAGKELRLEIAAKINEAVEDLPTHSIDSVIEVIESTYAADANAITTQVATNVTNISNNRTDIDKNTANIATNTANIAINAANIAKNTAAINKNVSAIAALDARVSALESGGGSVAKEDKDPTDKIWHTVRILRLEAQRTGEPRYIVANFGKVLDVFEISSIQVSVHGGFQYSVTRDYAKAMGWNSVWTH